MAQAEAVAADMDTHPESSGGARVNDLGDFLGEAMDGNDDAVGGVVDGRRAGVNDELVYRDSAARRIDDENLLVADFDAVRLIGKRHLDSKNTRGKCSLRAPLVGASSIEVSALSKSRVGVKAYGIGRVWRSAIGRPGGEPI